VSLTIFPLNRLTSNLLVAKMENNLLVAKLGKVERKGQRYSM
jgi:hypothetical protein